VFKNGYTLRLRNIIRYIPARQGYLRMCPLQSVSDRAIDLFQLQPQAGTSSKYGRVHIYTHGIRELDSAHGLEDIYRPVIKTARQLYRCWFSCKDAFPSSDMKDEWVVDVWNEACLRTGASPNLLPQDEEACLLFVTCDPASLGSQFTCNSMRFLTDMKMKIKHAVESSYEFDTSQAPNSIDHNASHAQALLAKMTFIYRVRLIASFAAN
jgi:hypothetical protein